MICFYMTSLGPKYLFTHVVHVPIQGSCNKIVYYIDNTSLSDFSFLYFNIIRLKAQPHAAALHTCDGVVKAPAMQENCLRCSAM